MRTEVKIASQELSKHCTVCSNEMPFEGYPLLVPVGDDEILKEKYGNYMAFVRGTASHTYSIRFMIRMLKFCHEFFAKEQELLVKSKECYCNG